MTVGQRIEIIIKNLGMNKNSFAKQLGVANTVIQNIVNERNNPSFELTSKISKVYAVNLDWLFFEEGEMFTSKQSKNLNIESEGSPERSNSETDKWKDKYIEQLELTNDLLKKEVEELRNKERKEEISKARSA